MRQPKLILLLLFTLLTLVLWRWAFSAQTCVALYQQVIYWVLLLAVAGLGCQLYRIYGKTWRESLRERSFWITCLLLLVVAVVQQIHEPREYKVVSDEISLVGMSQNLHYDREAAVPYRAYKIMGVFDILNSEADKRPALYPFLVSIVHDLSGYRPSNAFVANFLLGWLVLGLAYYLGFHFGGRRAAWLSVLLIASIPQLARSLNGAGMEPTNLAGILGLWILLLHYVKHPGLREQSALCLMALLLFNARYESPLFGLSIAIIILRHWFLERKVILSWTLVVCPLLFLPALWHRRIVEVNSVWWELFDRPEVSSPFSLGNIAGNIAHSWNFFGDLSINQPNNFFLLIAGVPALLLFLIYLLRRGRQKLNDWELVFLVMLPGFLLIYFLMMGYYWGALDNAVTQRLTLPFYLPLIFAVIWAVHKFPRKYPAWSPVLIAAIVFTIAVILPTEARHVYDQRYGPAQQLKWCEQFIEDNKDRDYVMISDWPFFWIAHGIEAIPLDQINANKGKLKFQLEYHPEKEFLICTRNRYRREQGTVEQLFDFVPLENSYVFEPIRTHHYNIHVSMTISKIIDVTGQQAQPYVPRDGSPDANDYFLHYFTNLP